MQTNSITDKNRLLLYIRPNEVNHIGKGNLSRNKNAISGGEVRPKQRIEKKQKMKQQRNTECCMKNENNKTVVNISVNLG